MAKQYKVKDINNNGKIDGWEQGKYDAINNSATKMGYAMKMGSGSKYNSPTNFKKSGEDLISNSPMMAHKEGHDPNKNKSGESDYYEKQYPGQRGADEIARYRINKEFKSTGLNADSDRIPGTRNPNYNPGGQATSHFESMFPNVKNTAMKSNIINKAIGATFDNNKSHHNKGFVQNKGNYNVSKSGNGDFLLSTKNEKNFKSNITSNFKKNLQTAYDLQTKGANKIKSKKGTYNKIQGNILNKKK